jgi:SOS response regulatory protein OraA/RecX
LAATASTFICCISNGWAIRGGIELGLAMEINEGEIYGPALARAYNLESKVADYPRIIIGDELIRYLRLIAANQISSAEEKAHALLAEKSLRLLKVDNDGYAFLDWLGDDMRVFQNTEILKNAYNFIIQESIGDKENRKSKLRFRYSLLRDYVESRLPDWGLKCESKARSPFLERGYLSMDICRWIQKHRSENQEWFDLAEDINLFAHKTMYDFSIPKSSAKHLLVSTAYIRCLSLYQGTILLVERGMIYEAATLTRGLMETLFVLCAAAKNTEFALQYIDSNDLKKFDLVSKMMLAGESIRKIIEGTITEDEIKKKRQELKAKGIRDFTIAEVAEKADLVDYHRTNYSFFSFMAAHPTPNSLDKYFEEGADGEAVSLLWGPEVEGVSKILSVAVESSIIAIERLGEVFEQPWHQQIEVFKDKFRRLGEQLSDFFIGHIRT